jgi:YfiH family protein
MPSEVATTLQPGWAATGVGALMSTRASGDLREPAAQSAFESAVGGRPVWLEQVHGATVVRIGRADAGAARHRADASITSEPGVACVVQVADCLPVLIAAPGARAVGAAHAGWRGLAGGVVENTVRGVCEAAGCDAADLEVWLGACIGPRRFEVGVDVLEAFGADPRRAGPRFAMHREGKWMADLAGLARDRLAALGVTRIDGGTWCTVEDSSRFFSFRRDRGVTGRMAAAVWIER